MSASLRWNYPDQVLRVVFVTKTLSQLAPLAIFQANYRTPCPFACQSVYCAGQGREGLEIADATKTDSLPLTEWVGVGKDKWLLLYLSFTNPFLALR